MNPTAVQRYTNEGQIWSGCTAALWDWILKAGSMFAHISTQLTSPVLRPQIVPNSLTWTYVQFHLLHLFFLLNVVCLLSLAAERNMNIWLSTLPLSPSWGEKMMKMMLFKGHAGDFNYCALLGLFSGLCGCLRTICLTDISLSLLLPLLHLYPYH